MTMNDNEGLHKYCVLHQFGFPSANQELKKPLFKTAQKHFHTVQVVVGHLGEVWRDNSLCK